MKIPVVLVLAMLGALPAFAQDQSSCKAYFQVLRAQAGTPGLRVGVDSAQKKWWKDHGQKKFPRLCASGADMSGSKPRYLVIWSKSRKIGHSSMAPAEVYGQAASALQATAPMMRIYQPRWDLASVTIVNVLNDGSLLLPPVYFEADDRVTGALTGAGPLNAIQGGSTKVLAAAVKYLFQERIFFANPN